MSSRKNDYLNLLPSSSFSFKETMVAGSNSDPGSHINTSSDPPRLVEPRFTSFMQRVLRDCHEAKRKVYSFIFNAIVLTLFVAVFALALYVCRTNKLSPREKFDKQERDKAYLLSKIRSFETDQAKHWFNEYLNPLQKARQDAAYFL